MHDVYFLSKKKMQLRNRDVGMQSGMFFRQEIKFVYAHKLTHAYWLHVHVHIGGICWQGQERSKKKKKTSFVYQKSTAKAFCIYRTFHPTETQICGKKLRPKSITSPKSKPQPESFLVSLPLLNLTCPNEERNF